VHRLTAKRNRGSSPTNTFCNFRSLFPASKALVTLVEMIGYWQILGYVNLHYAFE